ncbi:MAG: hypothetical protein ACE5JD_16110 [Candidatus Methylomirabilia bacterium]
MIQGVNAFIPFGAPESQVPRVDARSLSLALGALAPKSRADDGLAKTLERSFRLNLLEALSRLPAEPRPPTLPAKAVTPPPSFKPVPPRDGAALEDTQTPGVARPKGHEGPSRRTKKLAANAESDLIQKAAERAGVDPRFLQALRLVENGGPGREFGVLSVPAPTYEDQVRVAATTIGRNLERFKRAGGEPIDSLSGQYTDGFIRFFSSRYAPVGANNDPTGLNRYHAKNLIRLYAQLTQKA